MLLDETCYQLRDTVQGILASPTEIVGIELPPASVKLNLSAGKLATSPLTTSQTSGMAEATHVGRGAYAGFLFVLLAYLAYVQSGNWTA